MTLFYWLMFDIVLEFIKHKGQSNSTISVATGIHFSLLELTVQNNEDGQVNCKIWPRSHLWLQPISIYIFTNLVLICHSRFDTSFTHVLSFYTFSRTFLTMRLVTEPFRAST
jgi:hypothetical protein